jgi:hypothetical protein
VSRKNGRTYEHIVFDSSFSLLSKNSANLSKRKQNSVLANLSYGNQSIQLYSDNISINKFIIKGELYTAGYSILIKVLETFETKDLVVWQLKVNKIKDGF